MVIRLNYGGHASETNPLTKPIKFEAHDSIFTYISEQFRNVKIECLSAILKYGSLANK